MVQFRPAAASDLPALTRLWQTCFGDAPSFVNAFWKAVSPAVYAGFSSGAPVCMVCALDTALVDEAGESHRAAYLYAVCTQPAFRRQGLCRALLRHTLDDLRRRGYAFAALVPSEEGLFDFYGALGFRTIFYHRVYSLPAAAHEARIAPIDAEAYRNLRQMQLYGGFLSYPLPLLRWQQRCGTLVRVETGECICCAAAEKRGQTLLLQELLPDCPEAAAALAAHLGCRSVLVQTQGGDVPYGMALSLSGAALPERAYLALAFD